MVWVIPFCSPVAELNRWLGTQKIVGRRSFGPRRRVHIKSPRIHLHTPPNATPLSRWYDHEWLKADYKPDSPLALQRLPYTCDNGTGVENWHMTTDQYIVVVFDNRQNNVGTAAFSVLWGEGVCGYSETVGLVDGLVNTWEKGNATSPFYVGWCWG